MKHLVIRDMGPIKEADIALSRFNVIIGKQSSGKSCVLRIASYCAWVEKQIQQAQSFATFETESAFMDILCRYHKLTEYVHDGSYIMYETDSMCFSYNQQSKSFTFRWNEKGHFQYHMPKISYIPSERSIVSLLPYWKSEVSTYDCVLDFMKEWDYARRAIVETDEILNLGMNYVYNKSLEEDLIKLKNGKFIHLTNASSGVQSLIPLFISIDYITRHIYQPDYNATMHLTAAKKEKKERLIDLLYATIKQSQMELTHDEDSQEVVVHYNAREYTFRSSNAARCFEILIANYLSYQQTDIYLEEPENNLFPTTQCQLVDWLDEKTNKRKHQASVFLTTHSPYVLTYLLDKPQRGKRFFFTYENPKEKGTYFVKSLSLPEIEQIIAGGVDLYFNYESYIV